MAKVTVTGSLNDTAGNSLTNTSSAFVRFILRGLMGVVPSVTGSAVITELQIDALPDASGNISQTLWPNNQLTPATTFYTVEIWNLNRCTSRGNYLINSDTNLNSATHM